MTDLIKDIDDFTTKYGLYDGFTYDDILKRINFLQEELNELEDCFDEEDKAGIIDALVDLVYVAIGTAAMAGYDFNAHWNAVHKANMTKVRVETQEGYKWGITKPEGWIAPEAEHEQIIERTGLKI